MKTSIALLASGLIFWLAHSLAVDLHIGFKETLGLIDAVGAVLVIAGGFKLVSSL